MSTIDPFLIPRDYRRVSRVLRPYLDSGVVTLPDEVAGNMERGEALLAEATAIGSAQAARARLVARLIDGEDVAAEEYAAAATADVRRQALTEAAGRVLSIAMADLWDATESILAQVDAAIVTPALDVLREAAERTEEGDDLASLVRAGRHKDVKALSAAYDPAILARLKRADTLRSQIGAGAYGTATNKWLWLEDGRLLKDLDADAWLAALRGGVRVLPFVREEPDAAVLAVEAGFDLSNDVEGLDTFG